jgi:phenylpropionate dioxygenase-like ring-hydroxylating dioxygenase large terminal subunit
MIRPAASGRHQLKGDELTGASGVDVDSLAATIAAGKIPAGIYSDPAIFELEKERLFSRSWQFLAHTSEIPDPGDYVVRRIIDDSFIVVRDESGEINVLLNMCRHRGMQVCRAEAGNASHFRCPYHAWTYKNTGQLVGIPFHMDGWGGDRGLRRDQMGLVPAPRVGIYRGMIFGCLDPDAEDLEDFLAGFTFYLDLYVNQSAEGIELRGPQRWRVNSNWKIGAENFVGDSYHTPHTHASVVEIGLFLAPKANKRKEGALYWADSGGGTTYKLPTTDFATNLEYIGYPAEMIGRMGERWTDQQQRMIGEKSFIVSAATIFPNLSFVHNWPQVQQSGPVVPFISLRMWQPISATETEVLSWFAVDRNAPQVYKDASYKAYLMCFGSSGMFEQDDVENWTSITTVSKGRLGSAIELDSTMGLDPDGGTLTEPVPEWPGPGQAFVGYGEYNQRALLKRWSEALRQPAPARVARPADAVV